MGSSESREDSSTSIFFKIIIGILIKFIHLVFVVISKIISLAHTQLEQNPSPPTTEGLQSELECTNKEGECVRQRLRYQNEQLERVKEKHDSDTVDEQKKYGENI